LILVDCGFSVKEVTRRLAVKGIEPQQISAILVTHEHSDHISGVARLSNKFDIPVWLNRGTNLHDKAQSIDNKTIFNSHETFSIDDIQVTPVTVPHDSREAVQYIFSNEEYSLGILTDVGRITDHILTAYSNCQAMMIEFNYDWSMLMSSRYPTSLKQRVSGGLGHLSNEQSIDFLKRLKQDKLTAVTVMHRSEENNTEELVAALLDPLTKDLNSSYTFANQANGSDWQSL